MVYQKANHLLLIDFPPQLGAVRQVVVFLERAAAEGLARDQPRAQRAPLRDGRRVNPNLQSQGRQGVLGWHLLLPIGFVNMR